MEGTIAMCYTYVHEIADDTFNGDEKKSVRAAKLRADPTFQMLLRELELQHARGFSLHPKMEMLKSLVIQFLGQQMTDGERGNEEEQSRVMIFVTFRSVVEEIVEYLDTERPLIRAVKFVGQGTDKQGKKGFAQKQQLEVCCSQVQFHTSIY
jgi:ATP-dependent DNA helicase MPH1